MYQDLFSTFSGQLSLGIIIFVILMGGYFTWKFIRLSTDENHDKTW